MTDPRDTLNPATITRPERSSKRVARKKPLAWLPWALLASLALLLLLIFLVINAVDDDGPDGPAGDSLGQVDGSDGSGVNGENESGPDANTDGSGQPGQPQQPAGDFSGLTAASLVGGAGVQAAPVAAASTAKRDLGTAGTVLFAEGSADLDGNANKVIASAVQALRSAGATRVTVYGCTDIVAGEQVNDPLSQERADAVARALKSALPGIVVTTQARGQDSPVATNATEEGRQQNRRAAIVATG